MTRLQKWMLVLMSFSVVGWGVYTFRYSKAVQNHRWFQAKVLHQSKINRKEEQINWELRRYITALRYDHRVIDQAARDQLTLTRDGEIVVILPQ